MSSLKGKLALITGSSRGIGRAIAQRLAADGAEIAVHYGSRKSDGDETVQAIRDGGGKAFTVQADLASIGEIEAMFTELDRHFPALDILVNNAGIAPSGYIEDATPAEFDRIVATNLRGPYFITQHALKRMNRGSGRIINLSSNCTRVAYPEVSIYGLTKAGIQNMTLGLAQQLGKRGITVNTVVPGIVDTEMNASWLSPATKDFVAGITALGRLGEVEEIASVVAFLASDQASWVTGQSIEASGGCRL
jgi:NAD(P)-dependent dehydrogenase (short-subunit alcohol dehydrogenase family)